MADIFVEVDEALKQEKLELLWKKYGGILIGAIIAIILGTAANAGYKSWKTNHDTKQTDIYLSTFDKTSPTADDILSTTNDLEGGLKTLTQIKAAGTAYKNGNIEKAAKIYASITSDENADPNLKHLAAYMTAHTSSNLDNELKLVSFQAMAENDENPWNLYAKLDAALLLANEKKDYTAARKYLKEINDNEKAPKTLRQKAQSIDILYALKQSAK